MSHATTPTTFTLFPNLPIELRQKIWQLSIPDRLVEFGGIAPRNEAWSQVKGQIYVTERTAKLPSAYHVCRESRSEAIVGLKFGSRIDTIDMDTKTVLQNVEIGSGDHKDNVLRTRKTYFNFRRDVLYVNRNVFIPEPARYDAHGTPIYNIGEILDMLYKLIGKEKSERITRLALDATHFGSDGFGSWELFVEHIVKFKGLEEIVWVVQTSPPRPDYSQRKCFMNVRWLVEVFEHEDPMHIKRRVLRLYRRAAGVNNQWRPPKFSVVKSCS